MIIEQKKNWGYKCPRCSADVSEQIAMFDVTSYRALESACPACGEKLGTISRNTNGDYLIDVPCYVCREMHSYRIAHKLFWEKRLFSLGCTMSGYDLCYFGEKTEVENALEKLNGEILKRCELTEDMMDVCGERVQKALDVLQKIAAEGNLFCLCGESKIQVGVQEDQIVILCGACGAHERISLETEEDLQRLIERKTVVLVKQ